MVAQHLAAEAPELVRRLVLVATAGWSQRDGAGDRGALAAGGTRGSTEAADAGHSGALLLPAVFAAIPAAAAPLAPSGGPGATSASSFRPEPASGMMPAAGRGGKGGGARRCWQST